RSCIRDAASFGCFIPKMFPTSKNQSDGRAISHLPDSHASRISSARSRSSSSSESITHFSRTEASGTRVGGAIIGRDPAESVEQSLRLTPVWSCREVHPAYSTGVCGGLQSILCEEQC